MAVVLSTRGAFIQGKFFRRSGPMDLKPNGVFQGSADALTAGVQPAAETGLHPNTQAQTIVKTAFIDFFGPKQ